MDEFEKIRAFSVKLSKKTEEAVAAENGEQIPEEKPELVPEIEGQDTPVTPATLSPKNSDQADFLENWSNTPDSSEEDKRLSKTFWVVLVGVTVLVACLIGVIYLLLKGPIEAEEIVTIAPTPKPVKIRPENPGGMVIPDQDKVIYSRLTKDTVPAKVEKLFPEAEKPVMPEVVAEPVQQPGPEIPVFEEVEDVKVIQVAEPAPAEKGKKVEKPAFPKQEEKPTVQKKSEPIAPEKPKAETPAPKPEWKVQLFSSTDKAKVEKQWKIIQQTQKGLVSDMPVQIIPADIPGKGTFYRLQIGAFETRDMANNLCAKLKKKKQDCLPAK